MPEGDRRVLLSTGLSVYGLQKSAARREEFFIEEYFHSDLALGPGMTVFDMGANIGLFTLEVLRRGEGNVRVFACEPAPETFAFLQRNVHELFPHAPVSCMCCAVGEEPGRSTLYFKPRVSQLSSLQRGPLVDESTLIDAVLKDPPAELRAPRFLRPLAPAFLRIMGWWMNREVVEIPCEVKTVSQIMRESAVERVDLLKVDVEGAELAVLRGIEADDWPKIKAISAEVHDLEGRVQTMRAMLEAKGFDRIDFTQDWPFEGTNTYMLEASRTADGPFSASEASASPAIPPA